MRRYREIRAELNESSISRLWRHTQNHTCGMLSAFRNELTYKENLARHHEMMRKIQALGFNATELDGQYPEDKGTAKEVLVKERSIFVVNVKVNGDDGGKIEQELSRIAEAYEQDSILVIPHGGEGAYLFGTTRKPDAFIPYHKKEVLGAAKYGNPTSEYLSKIRGRRFAFENKE